MLLKKELGITLKSLTYWLVVLFIGAFLFTQLGSDFISLKQPEPGKNDYGIGRATDKHAIQQQTIFSLLQQYNSKGFNTYPFGFLKTVTPSKSDKATIKEILERATGKSVAELNQAQSNLAIENPQIDQFALAEKFVLAKDYTYPAFEKDMRKVEELIGKGSDFSKNVYLNQTRRQLNYEEATKNFQTTLTKDRVSGAFARMTCDYLGLVLALVPVFIVATVVLRDKRAQSQLVIHSKRISSFIIRHSFFSDRSLGAIASYSVQSIAGHSIRLCRSKISTCWRFAAVLSIHIGWSLPTIVAVIGISFLITTVFNGLVSVIFQLGFWLLSLMSNGRNIVGSVGVNLIPRFNTVGSREVFEQIFSELVINRVLWFALGLICFLLSCVIFDRKRKGRMHYGNSR